MIAKLQEYKVEVNELNVRQGDLEDKIQDYKEDIELMNKEIEEVEA